MCSTWSTTQGPRLSSPLKRPSQRWSIMPGLHSTVSFFKRKLTYASRLLQDFAFISFYFSLDFDNQDNLPSCTILFWAQKDKA